MILATERLEGCTSQSLDSYLRGLGFFVLAGEIEPSLRSWWDDDGALRIASPIDPPDLCARVVEGIRRDAPALRTPWRGKDGRERDFAETRNEAADDELDWFDACALSQAVETEGGKSAHQQRNTVNNPLLGEGASFGRGEIAAGYATSVSLIRTDRVTPQVLTESLIAVLTGKPIAPRIAKTLSIANAVLGAYQSGRATGPGSIVKDKKPGDQPLRSNVWDVVLVFTGLRIFRGTLARRPIPGSRVQASFPLVVRSRPLSTGSEGVHELRIDDERTFEFLAPLWTTPCTCRTLRHQISRTRLRLRRGVTRDTLDAVLVQAGHCSYGFGFDRLVRFAFVPVDPRKPARYAVRRGEVLAQGTEAPRRAVDEILPFLRQLERDIREESPSLSAAKRRLENALAAFAQKEEACEAGYIGPRRVQEALISLALLQTPAARATQELQELPTPRLSPAWFRLADDRSPEFRIARSLLAGLSGPRASILRETLVPHRQTDSGQFVLDSARMPPDLEHVSDPIAALVDSSLTALRRSQNVPVSRAGSVRFDDLVALLSGVLGSEGERRIALLSAALAAVYPADPPSAPKQRPDELGIGADTARLLLAAQPIEGEDDGSLKRTEVIASLLLRGAVDSARRAADRELRKRGLDLLLSPTTTTPVGRPALLALAVLLPLSLEARTALGGIVSIASSTPNEEESNDRS